MEKNHKALVQNGNIKFFNGNIFDYTHKTKEHCFVLGFEVLDNMPHDRLYRGDHPKVASTDDPDSFTHQSVIQLSYENKKEELSEKLIPIDQKDKLIQLFLHLYGNQPEMDHIQA